VSSNTVLRVAMGQMLVKAGQPAANLHRAVQCIAGAARAGCDLVVLPECLDIGWADGSARTLAHGIPGPHSALLCDAARQHGIFVAAGLVERAGPLLYNAAVLIDDNGRVCLTHRKINELHAITGGLYAVGDRLAVAHTRLGVMGMTICADNLPDSLDIAGVLARMGAQVLLAPSAWAVPPGDDQAREPYGQLWRGAYRALGERHGLPVVAVSSVGVLADGPWRGHRAIGCSLATGSDGVVRAQGGYGEMAEELIVCEVPLRHPLRSGRDERI
jgi:predicted amidohydrolase